MNNDSRASQPVGESRSENRSDWQFDQKTRSFARADDPFFQHEPVYGRDPHADHRPRVAGQRGLKVFLLIFVSLLLVAALAYGFSLMLDNQSDALPPPGGYSPPPLPTRPSANDAPPLYGLEDAPPLELHNKPSQGDWPLTIPEIAASVKPSVVGIVADGEHITSYGSGIILSPNGYIVTNAHVIAGALQITVVDARQREFEARLVGHDTKTDLAVLRVEAEDLPAATFGNSDELMVGELSVAIGNPLSMELFGSVTAGIISALDRHITLEDRTMLLLQTDAAINPGNSGGALVNAYGQVIGINSVKVMSSGVGNSSYEGIGFAIPSSTAIPIMESLIQHGYVPGRPSIGIVGEDVGPYYAHYFKVPQGVYIHSTVEGSDASRKDLQARDIITAINGIPISSMAELNAEKDKFAAGETVTLTIFRRNQTFDVVIVLTEQERE